MKLFRKVPCPQCPWRRKALPGWLGGIMPSVTESASYYADAVGNNEIPPCHLVDFGPDDDRSRFCVGALATSRNQCIHPDKTRGAPEAAREVGRRDDCFSHVREFYKHHTGEDYTSPLLRLIGE